MKGVEGGGEYDQNTIMKFSKNNKNIDSLGIRCQSLDIRCYAFWEFMLPTEPNPQTRNFLGKYKWQKNKIKLFSRL